MIKYEIVTYFFLSTDKWVKTDWFANDGIAHVKNIIWYYFVRL